MINPSPDRRSPERRRLDEQIAAEPPLPQLGENAMPMPVEHYLYANGRPRAVAGVVENGVARPVDPAVKLPEQSRVFIVPAEVFPKPGTPEWGKMNQRRGELIDKDIMGTLTETEQAEYELLQRLSLAALEEAFPEADALGEKLRAVEERVRDKPSANAAFPKPGTPEWGKMNQRRAELIRLKLQGTLTETERIEYETLQRNTRAALDEAFPFPEHDEERERALEERLAKSEGSGG